MGHTKFFTNHEGNTLHKKFEGIFHNNKNLHFFDVLVGYFRASGYFKIRPLTDDISTIRILVGIDIDAISVKMQEMGTLFQQADADQIKDAWKKNTVQDMVEAHYSFEVEEGVLQFIDDVKEGRVQIKAHPSKNIHAKIYILRPENFNEHSNGVVITGSSNLTEAGLGTKRTSNYEFNVLLNEYEDVKFATDEFNRLWDEGVEISYDFVNEVKQQTHLQEITPYQLYLKTLIEYFGNEIEFDPNSITDLPQSFKRLSYQMDAVNQGYEILKKHNGCFLSDVVGLGKTLIATLILRQFYHKNNYPDYRSRILLVIPRALEAHWKDTLKKFKMDDAVKIVSNGSLHQVEDHNEYDMIVVDEAHKFRNNSSKAYENLQLICKAKTRQGADKKVLLLTATPLNNRPDDLRNQLLLFQDGNRTSLGFSLTSFFNVVKKQYKKIYEEKDKEKADRELSALNDTIRNRVVEPLMVRRTRTDLFQNERYRKDLKEQNIKFPKVLPPIPIYYKLAPHLDELFDNTLSIINNKNLEPAGLCYMRYRAVEFLVGEKRKRYQRSEFIAQRLVAIMRTLLLKRMDSSFIAFKTTLENFVRSSEAMVKMIENNKIYIAPNLDVEDYVVQDSEEELLKIIEEQSSTDKSILECTCADFDKEFINGVKRDHAILMQLLNDWNKITEDPKLDIFKKELPNLLNKAVNPEQKLIIFTESMATKNYLCDKLGRDDVIGIDSNTISHYKQHIKDNFDANATHNPRTPNYNILITTDVLAEGINLHRANTVVNYDTPWNATRLMQRIGRINRIGSKSEKIYIYNFFPTAQVNDQIQLEKRAHLKLQTFHSVLGEDSQIFSEREKTGTFQLYDDSIVAEKSETLPYLEEIRQYRKEYPSEYNRLKQMPVKVRSAVSKEQLKKSTVVFLRTADKHTSSFYFVDGKNELEIYSFTQAMQLLKATPDDTAKKLPKWHHDQVSQAINRYDLDLNQRNTVNNYSKTLAPADRAAINYLKAFSNIADAESNAILKKTEELIRDKVFTNLSTDLKKIQKNNKGIVPDQQLAAVLNYLKQFNIDSSDIKADSHEINVKSITPVVIISQSYV